MEKELDTQRLAEALQSLRGRMSQPQVEKLSRVPQYTIGKLERAEIQKPSFEDIVKLGKSFGLSPTDMAAIVGLYPPPENGEDDDSEFTHRLLIALEQIRVYAHDLDRSQQNQLADLLSAMITSERQKKMWDDGGDTRLPAWARRKVLLSVDGESDETQ